MILECYQCKRLFVWVRVGNRGPRKSINPRTCSLKCDNRLRYLENKDKFFTRHRSNRLKRVYGLTVEEYQRMLAEQNYVCKICKSPSKSGRALAVDHDHNTGLIRGLLCFMCNANVGIYENGAEIFLSTFWNMKNVSNNSQQLLAKEQTRMAILDPGLDLNLRPMKYPVFFEMFKTAIKNTWTVDEIDFVADPNDLKLRMTAGEVHLIRRLVAFFATGDSIVGNNLVLNLYKHVNSPEARMYLSRQLYEEALHVQFYLTLLDTYIPDQDERAAAFRAVENIPSIKKKADFCNKYLYAAAKLDRLLTHEDRQEFIINLLCFATCIEGLFFFGAFAYVYFLRSKGLLKGLADGTDWVFRDESMHLDAALKIVEVVRVEEPELFNNDMNKRVIDMIKEAVECEMQFAEDVLSLGVAGMSATNMREYLQFLADQRFMMLGIPPQYHSRNPFGFMVMQGAQGLGNLFERSVSEYQKGTPGSVKLDAEF